MSCAREPMVESYALERLDDSSVSEMRDHLAACASCARRAGRFEIERALFVRRAALPAPAPPAFADVLARATERAPRKLRRAGLWSLLAAAAVLLIGVAFAGRAPSGESTAIVAERAPTGATSEDQRVVADVAANRAEQAYAACLVGTPNCPAPAAEPEPGDPHQDEGCSVTCETGEPHPGEVLESGTEGECGP